MKESIKPCPFCKGTNVTIDSKAGPIRQGVQRKTFSVRCNKCHARGPTTSGVYPSLQINEKCPEYEESIKRWNNR